MKKIYAIFVCLLFLGTILTAAAVVGAPKPEKPPKPNPPGPTATGTLFYNLYENEQIWVYTMNADGSGKTKQTLLEDGVLPLSRLKHVDYYWHLDFQVVEGTYPDGLQRHEIFAIRDDNGKTVQLTNDANLATADDYHGLAWGIDDEYISWCAKKWVFDTTWSVDEAGIYTAAISFDSNGDVTGLSSSPTLVWESGLYYSNGKDAYYPHSREHDWSPDGTKIVQYTSSAAGLTIVDVSTQTESSLTPGFAAKWSPDGSLIAFLNEQDLRIIKPDGTGEKVLVADKDSKSWEMHCCSPAWSPDSNFVSFAEHGSSFKGDYRTKSDIYYVGIDGDGKTCLTRELSSSVWKTNWHWR